MTTEPKRLYRSRNNRMIAGVCGGLAEYLNLDPTLVRVLWVLLSIFPGSILGGVIVYLVMALIVPEAPVASGPPAYPPPHAPPYPPPPGP